MGFLDDVMRQVGAASGRPIEPGQHGLAQELLGLIAPTGVSGGLAGLVNMFNQKGLGNIVNSWISTGQNLPITAEQIQAVLGSPQIQALAAKAGISPEMASSAISQILPHLVDSATPNGEIPAAATLRSVIAAMSRKA